MSSKRSWKQKWRETEEKIVTGNGAISYIKLYTYYIYRLLLPNEWIYSHKQTDCDYLLFPADKDKSCSKSQSTITTQPPATVKAK